MSKFFWEKAWNCLSFYRIFVVLLRQKRNPCFRGGEQEWGSPKVLKNFFKKTLKKIWRESKKGITFAPANGEGPGGEMG